MQHFATAGSVARCGWSRGARRAGFTRRTLRPLGACRSRRASLPLWSYGTCRSRGSARSGRPRRPGLSFRVMGAFGCAVHGALGNLLLHVGLTALGLGVSGRRARQRDHADHQESSRLHSWRALTFSLGFVSPSRAIAVPVELAVSMHARNRRIGGAIVDEGPSPEPGPVTPKADFSGRRAVLGAPRWAANDSGTSHHGTRNRWTDRGGLRGGRARSAAGSACGDDACLVARRRSPSDVRECALFASCAVVISAAQNRMLC
jgi:hypothetical protein